MQLLKSLIFTSFGRIRDWQAKLLTALSEDLVVHSSQDVLNEVATELRLLTFYTHRINAKRELLRARLHDADQVVVSQNPHNRDGAGQSVVTAALVFDTPDLLRMPPRTCRTFDIRNAC